MHRLFLLLLLALFPSCAHTLQKKQGPTDEELLELYATTATYLYEDESLVRAQDQAVKALEIEPENPAMRRMIGWIRLRLGTNEDLIIAERFFRDLRADGDTNNATVLGLATTLERLGTAHDQASRDYASGQREPEDGEDAERLARELAEEARDHWNEALELYELTLNEGEGSTNAMNGLQRVYALLGDYEQSLSWSAQLLERSDEELFVWRRMLTQEDLSEAEETLFRDNERIATRLQVETHLFASTILNRLGRYEEAVAHLDTVAETVPDLPQAYSLRAQLYGQLGQYDEAIEDLDQFLRLSDQPFEAEEVQRAFALRLEYEKLARSD